MKHSFSRVSFALTLLFALTCLCQAQQTINTNQNKDGITIAETVGFGNATSYTEHLMLTTELDATISRLTLENSLLLAPNANKTDVGDGYIVNGYIDARIRIFKDFFAGPTVAIRYQSNSQFDKHAVFGGFTAGICTKNLTLYGKDEQQLNSNQGHSDKQNIITGGLEYRYRIGKKSNWGLVTSSQVSHSIFSQQGKRVGGNAFSFGIGCYFSTNKD